MEFLWEGLVQAFRWLFGGDRQTLHAVYVSLFCTIISVTLAACLAVPYGAWLGLYRGRTRRAQVFVLRVGMALPTVVIGLLVYAFLSRRGLLGSMDLLYTKTAIIAGETLLAFPLLAALSHAATTDLPPEVAESSLTLGAGRFRTLLRSLGEVRAAMAAAYLLSFGRCLTELGIAITVGGNLAMRTRPLPSTGPLELSRGNFAEALAPGIILLFLACGAVAIAYRLVGEGRK